MASNQKNPQKKNPSEDLETHPESSPESSGKQQEQKQAQPNQPGEQDKENANKASDAQLNQGGAGQGRITP